MRAFSLTIAALGFVFASASPAFADDTKMVPPQATAAPAKSGAPHAHQKGMQHGGQQMHDKMMHDHEMGMQSMSKKSGMKMGCGDKAGCKGKGMKGMTDKDKPADKPMPMEHQM
ncbi:hypothetical protein HJG53_12680 [Sphingomonas sp. ID1715]|uniref:hypothetical protein n=1 Tax=Sphingomonas sp. ID1715 TaxID=1656898 RepID=UPI001489E215|nr:hypothetical protein [Sphingomonas sp. ID1715]NNM77764.1 hypothetical protein [Sphingomonas sp. ID1715]